MYEHIRPTTCRLLFAAAFAAGGPLLAEESPEEHPTRGMPHEHTPKDSKPWWEWDHATGNWGGTREWLEERGVTLELVYTGEVMANTRGGRNTKEAVEYLGNVDLSVELSPEKMGGWKGGLFYARAQNNHSAQFTPPHVGGFQVASHFEPEKPFTQLSEYWYFQELLDGKLSFKIGKQEVNSDFAATFNGAYFTQSSAGTFPTLIFPTFAEFGLGFSLFGKPTDYLHLQAGVFDGAANGESTTSGPSFVSREGGHVGLFEFHLHTEPMGSFLPGSFRFGAWYHTGDFEELPGFPPPGTPRTFTDNRGIYFTMDQVLFRENPKDKEDEQGLSALAHFAHAPGDRNEVRYYYGGGLTYKGLFPGRADDVFGVFVGHVDFSGRLKRPDGLTRETVIEVNYNIQATKSILLRPDFQYFIRPGGDRRLKDAHVVGLRWSISF